MILSICIPTYNRINQLDNCLNSGHSGQQLRRSVDRLKVTLKYRCHKGYTGYRSLSCRVARNLLTIEQPRSRNSELGGTKSVNPQVRVTI